MTIVESDRMLRLFTVDSAIVDSAEIAQCKTHGAGESGSQETRQQRSVHTREPTIYRYYRLLCDPDDVAPQHSDNEWANVDVHNDKETADRDWQGQPR